MNANGARLVAFTLALATLAAWAGAQAPPVRPGSTPPAHEEATTDGLTDLVNGLLGGLMGGVAVDGASLQKDVEEAGGIPFRKSVPVDFLTREQLARYLRELLDTDYPATEARADERLLAALDLLPPATELRGLRAKVLEENVAGFYDDRPDRRRLYAVSADRSFSPMNQIVLAHELRHALQDQYTSLNDAVGPGLSDFDDRKLAVVSLFEGDATLLMERFVKQRLGVPDQAGGQEPDLAGAAALGAPGMFELPNVPPVVRDQLLQPYLEGLKLARAIWTRGGAAAMRDAWARPPDSTEQVLHPERYFTRERPRIVRPSVAAPSGARAAGSGVVGEMLLRTLLGEGHDEAAAGWGGDLWSLWDVKGRSAFAWRSEWDTTKDAAEFHEALLRRFTRVRGNLAVREGWACFVGAAGWSFAVRRDGGVVELVSSDDSGLLSEMLARDRRVGATLDFPGQITRVAAARSLR